MTVVLGKSPAWIKIFIVRFAGSMKKFEDARGRRQVLDVEKKKGQECTRRRGSLR